MSYKLLKEQVDIPAGEVFELDGEEYVGQGTARRYPKVVVESKGDFFVKVTAFFQPAEGELCFRFNEQGQIAGTSNRNDEEAKNRMAFGNCFRTEAEARKASDKVKDLLHKPDLLQ